VLEVRIKDIQLHYDWGYNMIRPLAGRCRTTSTRRPLIHIPLDKQKNTGRLPWGSICRSRRSSA
jgi:acetamidase/formamidase